MKNVLHLSSTIYESPTREEKKITHCLVSAAMGDPFPAYLAPGSQGFDDRRIIGVLGDGQHLAGQF